MMPATASLPSLKSTGSTTTSRPSEMRSFTALSARLPQLLKGRPSASSKMQRIGDIVKQGSVTKGAFCGATKDEGKDDDG